MGDGQSYSEYSRERLNQLRESKFAFWVYRAEFDCPEQHQELDGLVLPPDHAFWSRFYPPLDENCGCYVVGTHLESGIKRLSGNPDKQLPHWCDV